MWSEIHVHESCGPGTSSTLSLRLSGEAAKRKKQFGITFVQQIVKQVPDLHLKLVSANDSSPASAVNLHLWLEEEPPRVAPSQFHHGRNKKEQHLWQKPN